MIKPVFRVVGLDQATCDSEYNGAETVTKPIKPGKPTVLGIFRADSATEHSTVPKSHEVITVRLKDILPALNQASANRLSWVRDFENDPVVVTKDLYDVLLTLERLRRTA